jgi:hypothetical protein
VRNDIVGRWGARHLMSPFAPPHELPVRLRQMGWPRLLISEVHKQVP